MDKLLIFNFICVALIVIGLLIIKKFVKSVKTQNIILIVTALVTILFHYSSFLIKLVTGSDAFDYLKSNPNLILPIYPCNVVMWSALILAVLKNKQSKFFNFLVDYVFWFGIISTLVGMFANVDFIKNPTLLDYENVKSIGAHATLLFNVLVLPLFGFIKIDVKRNIINIFISVVMMAVIGCYCNLVFYAVASKEVAYSVNSMFLMHSPFDGVNFLIYPVIALIGLPLYFIIFVICDLIAHKKGERFYNKK